MFSKNLVELALNNQNKNNLQINLSAGSGAILKKLNEGYPYGRIETSNPIVVDEKPSWQSYTDSHGTFIKKIYRFGTYKHMMYFLNESLNLSQELDHFPELMVKEKNIEAVLYTKDINDITETDIKMSKKFDEIYEEIRILYRD